MKSKDLMWLASIWALLLILSIGVVGQNSMQANLSGFINDYTPKTGNPVGPWEVRGEWSMLVKGHSGKADFSATLTMVRSDYWVFILGDPELPETRVPHTHHITVVDGDVTMTDTGFRINGPATITANGSPAGFSPSPIQIDVTGGDSIQFSNIHVTFQGPASGHFGTYPLDGVVRLSSQRDRASAE